ncbi:hypothetical protein B0H11DRAFT_2135886 [Mycena galericulata]|nr:hypothetical protein B0H11DRAFT_2135886 [Mycena galericulata]
MASVQGPLDLNLESSYGLLLIGCFLSAAIWGVSLVQTILYFFIYEKDLLKLKLLVLLLIVLDTANEILILNSVWPALILHWGRVDILEKSEGTIALIHHVWVAALVATGVQSYYIWRIYTLSGHKRLLPCLLIALVAWQIIGLGPYNFLAFGKAPVSAGKQSLQLTAVAISLRACGAATDILVTGAMIYLLLKPRNSNHFPSTQKIVFRLIIMSINSGLWTALFAVLDLISIVAFPTDFTFCVFELPLCSMYLSTMLVNLNARKFIGHNIRHTSMDLSDMSRSRNNRNFPEPIHFVEQPEGLTQGCNSQDQSRLSAAPQKITPVSDIPDVERHSRVYHL